MPGLPDFITSPTVRNTDPSANDFGVVARVIIGGVPSAVAVAVPASGTTVELAAAHTHRRGLLIYNDADLPLYVKLGMGASTSSWTVKLYTNDAYELPNPMYLGSVTGVWAAGAVGQAMVTESVL